MASDAEVKKTRETGKWQIPPGPGRPKGALNKTTTLLKDAILQAASQAGNGNIVDYLQKQATDNPGPFLGLLGKVLPMQVVGDSENPLVHEIVFRVVEPK